MQNIQIDLKVKLNYLTSHLNHSWGFYMVIYKKNLADELFYKWTLFSAYCLIWKTHEKAMPMSVFLSLCKKNEETRNRQKLMANLYCYSCVQIELLTKC